MTEPVKMYSKEADAIEIDVNVLFRDGNLIFDGCDMRSSVEKLTIAYDYEYWATVPQYALPKL